MRGKNLRYDPDTGDDHPSAISEDHTFMKIPQNLTNSFNTTGHKMLLTWLCRSQKA